jgi:hypothetical protein
MLGTLTSLTVTTYGGNTSLTQFPVKSNIKIQHTNKSTYLNYVKIHRNIASAAEIRV